MSDVQCSVLFLEARKVPGTEDAQNVSIERMNK